MTSKWLFIAAVGAFVAATPSFAQSPRVGTLEVQGGAPESVSVDLKGKDAPAVRQEIYGAARLVCHNAVLNGHISAVEEHDCKVGASDRGLAEFAVINRLRAAPRPIVLSAR